MRHLLAVTAASFAFCLGTSLVPGTAGAGPVPVLAVPGNVSAMTEKAGWRRYCRLYGCPPPGYVPPPAADALAVTPDGDVVAVPLRPASCGEFHYWNGEACVDARYSRPYLGPIW
jgi:hypothetical protein